MQLSLKFGTRQRAAGGKTALLDFVQWGEDQEPAELPDFVDDDEAAGGGGGPPDSFGFGRAAS